MHQSFETGSVSQSRVSYSPTRRRAPRRSHHTHSRGRPVSEDDSASATPFRTQVLSVLARDPFNFYSRAMSMSMTHVPQSVSVSAMLCVGIGMQRKKCIGMQRKHSAHFSRFLNCFV